MLKANEQEVNDIVKTISTIAIWGAVAAVLINLKVNGDGFLVFLIMVGMTASLSAGAAFSTVAIWRSPRPTVPSSSPAEETKVVNLEV